MNKTLLDESDGNVISIGSGSGYNYSLSLATTGGQSVATLSTSDTSTGLVFSTADGLSVASVKETRDAGWIYDSASRLSATYYKGVDSIHASLSGLSTAATSANVSFSAADKVITVSASALTTGDAILTSETYTLALSGASTGDVDSDGVTDTYFGFGGASNEWIKGSDSTSVTYESHNDGGWKLASNSKAITYTSKDETRHDLFTVSGLKKGFETSGISFAGTSAIMIKAIALSTTEISVTDNDTNDDYKGFKFVFDEETANLSESGTKYGFSAAIPEWKKGSVSGTFIYQYTTAEGWTIKDGKIEYTAATPTTLATITGLKAGLSLADLDSVIDKASDGGHSGVFTLTRDMLGDNGVTLSVEGGGSNYTLALSGASTGDLDGDGKDDKYLGFEGRGGYSNTDDYWKIDGTTATYIHNYGKGWTLSEDDKSIAFSASSQETLATIKNLGVREIDEDHPKQLVGVTVDGTNISISSAVLSKTSTATELIDGTNNFTFKLMKIDTDDTDSVAGFSQGANYWDATNGTAVYRYDIAEGWKLTAVEGASGTDKIEYTPLATNELATITGLAGTVTNISKSSIEGITVSTDTASLNITLDNRVLGNSNVELKPTDENKANYKLVLADSGSYSVANSEVATINVWDYTNGNATYKTVKPKYYSKDSDRFIGYTAEEGQATLASLTGLAKDLELSEDRRFIKAKDTVNDSGSAVTGASAVTVVDTSGSEQIKVWKDGFTDSDIKNNTADSKYSLESSGVNLPDVSDQAWTISTNTNNGATAVMTGTIAKGYTVSEDKKSIIYSPDESNKPIITLKGLSNDVKGKLSSDGSAIEGVIVDTNGKVILDNDVLGGHDVTISVSGGTTNYDLQLKTAGDSTASDNWNISGNRMKNG